MNRYDVLTRYYHVRVALGITFAFACLLSFAGIASATLIGDSIEYDGHVKSGAATGVEQYKAAPAFPPITFSMPAINGALAAPLVSNASHSLSASETEFADAYNGQNGYQHVVITIQASPSVDNVFVNPLDPGVSPPILLDGVFHTSIAGQKIDVAHFGIEDLPASVSPPFPNPITTTISGLGTAANPLHVQLGIGASQVSTNRGAVKLHIYYKTSTAPVPEPASWAMLVSGVVSVVSVAARRRRS